MMMAMIQLDLDEPSAIGLALHGEGYGIPVIKIPSQVDIFSIGRQTDKVDGLDHLLGGIAVGSKERTDLVHG